MLCKFVGIFMIYCCNKIYMICCIVSLVTSTKLKMKHRFLMIVELVS